MAGKMGLRAIKGLRAIFDFKFTAGMGLRAIMGLGQRALKYTAGKPCCVRTLNIKPYFLHYFHVNEKGRACSHVKNKAVLGWHWVGGHFKYTAGMGLRAIL